jgi:hypothetical protein
MSFIETGDTKMAYKINERVVEIGEEKLEYGYVTSINGNFMEILFDGYDETLVYEIDDEYIMSADDWSRGCREFAAEARCERLYFGFDA